MTGGNTGIGVIFLKSQQIKTAGRAGRSAVRKRYDAGVGIRLGWDDLLCIRRSRPLVCTSDNATATADGGGDHKKKLNLIS